MGAGMCAWYVCVATTNNIIKITYSNKIKQNQGTLYHSCTTSLKISVGNAGGLRVRQMLHGVYRCILTILVGRTGVSSITSYVQLTICKLEEGRATDRTVRGAMNALAPASRHTTATNNEDTALASMLKLNKLLYGGW